MPPKSIRTRQKIGEVGVSSALPDVGVSFTDRDLIAAIHDEMINFLPMKLM